ncbi:hypothetical protein GCM10010398_31520 [Streptomyces fimbriatus]
MLRHGVTVSHETVRRWCLKSGQACADGLCCRLSPAGDKRHLGGVFIRINGERRYGGGLSSRTAASWTSSRRTAGTKPRPGGHAVTVAAGGVQRRVRGTVSLTPYSFFRCSGTA